MRTSALIGAAAPAAVDGSGAGTDGAGVAYK